MRRRFPVSIGLVLILVASAMAADDPFTGTWREVTSSNPANHELLILAPNGDGITIQGSGTSAITHYGKDFLSEDGTTWNIVRVDDHTLKSTFARGGKIIARETATVSPDGKQYTRVQQQAGSNRQTMMEHERIGSVPKGDAFFGAWKPAPLTYTIRVNGDAFDFTTNRGADRKGKLDGKEYTNSDDGSKMQAHRADSQTIEIRLENPNTQATQVMTWKIKGDKLTRTILRKASTGSQGGNSQRPDIMEFERIK